MIMLLCDDEVYPAALTRDSSVSERIRSSLHQNFNRAPIPANAFIVSNLTCGLVAFDLS